MVKLTLPLGSESASGQVGKSIIYQGTRAKIYRSPNIKKVAAQLQAQEKFQAVNRTVRSMGPFARAAMESLFGRNWIAYCYQGIIFYWDELETYFNALSGAEKIQWYVYAPSLAMTLDPALVFYVCAWGLYKHMTDNALFQFEFWEVGDPNAEGSRDWWDRSLDGVLGIGKFDQDNASLPFNLGSGQWVHVNDTNAYDGSYYKTNSAGPVLVEFWMRGNGFGVFYKQAVAFGGMIVYVDGGQIATPSQNDPETIYQKEWRSPTLALGLHRITIQKTLSGDPINIDAIVIYG